MNIALELWTTLNSSKKYYGKKVFASEEKKANITVLPDHMVFLTSWKRCNSKYRRESHPPRLNNERRQFNLAPLNPMSPLPQSKKTTTPNPPPKIKNTCRASQYVRVPSSPVIITQWILLWNNDSASLSAHPDFQTNSDPSLVSIWEPYSEEISIPRCLKMNTKYHAKRATKHEV